MADVTLTVYDVVRAGTSITDNDTTIATANDYYFPNDGKTVLHVANASGSTVTVTMVTPNTVDGLAITDKTATLATAKSAVFGPFPPGVYNDVNGLVHCTFNQIVDVIALRI